MKKLLFITFLLFTTFSFAQQNENSSTIVKKEFLSTITSISASPNPFNIKTSIYFQSTKNQLIDFTIKNLLGKTVYYQQINAVTGVNSFIFEKNDLTKGMYIYTFQSGTEVVSKRLVIQ
ncbi:T9SS C-terminal target domain-containing protein [Lutibacter sp. HS1-25]|uniref:T9SS type A sorting domain-containing protein n=1 Tax=Lutibacter sp. HS1-25 TaxID=2485000 RepID=UPI0010104DF1|nr:T9SS type A sorting domain-containing protein [Lutibacter sp. HS1-25]RXP53385.1 T9SS C-terminal target domain-containing protein [Lutibacter sp. HS1-25]